MAGKCKTEGEPLGATISFRVQESVYSEFEAQRQAANMTKSELFRDYIAKNKVHVIARPAPSRDAKRAVFLLQKASNNINQLAHRANKDSLTGLLTDEYYKELTKQLAQLNRFMLSQTSEVKNDN